MLIGEKSAAPSRGLAYLGLMLAIALIGLGSAFAVQWGVRHGQRSAEAQLLAIGEEFQTALQRYADATANGLPRNPASLQELLRDPRYPGVVRHLRRLHADPFTGQPDWVLIQDSWGRIDAIHSRSPLQPLQTTGFEPALFHLEGAAATYEDWWFRGPLFQPQPRPNGTYLGGFAPPLSLP